MNNVYNSVYTPYTFNTWFTEPYGYVTENCDVCVKDKPTRTNDKIMEQ